jgi:hypothetical protein
MWATLLKNVDEKMSTTLARIVDEKMLIKKY